MNKLISSLLHLNGWVAVLIGCFIMIDPVTMFSSYDLPTDLSAGLMSELRAPGGLLAICGLLIVRNSLAPQLHQQGLQISILVYGSYGIARLISISLDGLPPAEILITMGIELGLVVLSTLSLIALSRQSTTTPMPA